MAAGGGEAVRSRSFHDGGGEEKVRSSAGGGADSGVFGHLSEEEIQELREIFSLVDKDGGGTITADELMELMETLGISATKEEVDAMVAEIDEDQNGSIDFAEFCAVMTKKVSTEYSPGEVKDAFRVFQGTAPSGYIRVSDVVAALSTYGEETLSKEEATELVGHLTADANNLINYDEFVDVVMADTLAKHRK